MHLLIALEAKRLATAAVDDIDAEVRDPLDSVLAAAVWTPLYLVVFLCKGQTHPPFVLLEPLAVIQDLHEERVRNYHVAAVLHALRLHAQLETLLDLLLYMVCPAASAELVAALQVKSLVERISNSLFEVTVANDAHASILVGKTGVLLLLLGLAQFVEGNLVVKYARLVGNLLLVFVPQLLGPFEVPVEVPHHRNYLVVVQTDCFLDLRYFCRNELVKDVFHFEKDEISVLGVFKLDASNQAS